MKKYLLTLTTLLLVTIFTQDAFAQIPRGSFGGGLNLGGHRGFGPSTSSFPMGIGFEALLSYKLNDKITLTGLSGYRPIREKYKQSSKVFANKLAFSDLLVEYDIANTSYGNPFISTGMGLYSIGFIAAKNDRLQLGIEGAFGAGFRTFLTPQMELKTSLTQKFTSDGIRTEKHKSYFTSTIGLTYYLKKRTPLDDENLFSNEDVENMPLESDLGVTPSQLVDYSRSLDSNEEFQDLLNAENPPAEIQEYKRLQERVNTLIELISQKDTEITNLKQFIVSQDSGSTNAAAAYDSDADAQVEFTYAYEDGLYKFYSRRFTDAIEIFNSLVENYPNHYLASNCYYWLGEAYFSIQDYSQSVLSLERVLEVPTAIKRDDALYMMGRAYQELHQPEKAREAFGRVINEYPRSEFVSKSLEILSNLR